MRGYFLSLEISKVEIYQTINISLFLRSYISKTGIIKSINLNTMKSKK